MPTPRLIYSIVDDFPFGSQAGWRAQVTSTTRQAKHQPSNVADKLMTFNSAMAPIIVIVLAKDSSIEYTELCLTARAAFLLQRMSIG
jgi:hypothetical protein